MTITDLRAGAILSIDLGAIRKNYQMLATQGGAAACAAVLKADAYGLGAAQVAPVLYQAGCRHFFVAHLEEGVRLRLGLADDADIYVLHGAQPGTEPDLSEYGLTPVINSLQQMLAWRELARVTGRALPCIIQIDTGMSRMGIPAAELETWLAEPKPLEHLQLHYLMSHLAVADEPDNEMNAIQLSRLLQVRRRLGNVPASLANSSGIFLGTDYHFDLLRPGAALYGVNPCPGTHNPMLPVVTLQGKIIQTRMIGGGDYVGYSLAYQASESRCIATIAVGYADGWLRSLSGKGIVNVGGFEAPVIGRVSMDSITVDVSGVPPALLAPGALVELLSATRTVDEVAACGGTIGYEILTSLGSRYHRRYIDCPDVS